MFSYKIDTDDRKRAPTWYPSQKAVHTLLMVFQALNEWTVVNQIVSHMNEGGYWDPQQHAYHQYAYHQYHNLYWNI
jgi:hypothetical protein